ncbi:hypothetical protein PVL29_010114 [Vitis rotundifolia]|uniref:FAS1 domain-containing protein n=1 Tax=Vitis rotundifolia TaxID=103349 RepID=A0AA38ZT12_VITRO|nr:hypothetical protein PVL29_010114 [Vitis rotundifolia]
MMKKRLSPTLLLLIFSLLCTTTSGQTSAPAQSPSGPLAPSASSGPADIIAILRKARKFSTFIGLLKSTQMDSEINSELKKKSNAGFTIFAPTDSAFLDLKTATLKSFTDDQKAALTKFHMINSFLTISQFQTMSNPLHTSAMVNMTTGLVNTTVDSTVYSDGQLAVYEIPQVLLSQGILSPQAPAPAPLPPKPKKATPLNSHAPSTSTTVSVDSSGATGLPHSPPIVVSTGVAQFSERPASTFIGLLKSTQMDAEINSELKKKSNAVFTIFAPTDSAFSDLKTSTLNSFADDQKAALTKFHIINSFLTISQFQTVSNPLHTSANGNTKEFPLNVIGNGTQVNMTTGLVNTTVDSAVYSDGQLAVYEIPQVLLSQVILRTQAPAPAPLPPKPKKVTPLNSQAPSRSTTSAVDSSDGTALPHHAPIVVSIGVAVLAALRLCL